MKMKGILSRLVLRARETGITIKALFGFESIGRWPIFVPLHARNVTLEIREYYIR